WQSGAWVFLVLKLSNGCDVLFLVLWKRRSNNNWYSMMTSCKGHRAEGNARMSSHDVRIPPQHCPWAPFPLLSLCEARVLHSRVCGAESPLYSSHAPCSCPRLAD